MREHMHTHNKSKLFLSIGQIRRICAKTGLPHTLHTHEHTCALYIPFIKECLIAAFLSLKPLRRGNVSNPCVQRA